MNTLLAMNMMMNKNNPITKELTTYLQYLVECNTTTEDIWSIDLCDTREIVQFGYFNLTKPCIVLKCIVFH